MAPKKQASEPKKKKATVDDKTVSIAMTPICVLLHTCLPGAFVPSIAKNQISPSVNHKTDALSLIVRHEK